ncbi:MAG: hypothetical protein RLZZ450_6522 [Pseudomonadota bacterium]
MFIRQRSPLDQISDPQLLTIPQLSVSESVTRRVSTRALGAGPRGKRAALVLVAKVDADREAARVRGLSGSTVLLHGDTDSWASVRDSTQPQQEVHSGRTGVVHERPGRIGSNPRPQHHDELSSNSAHV